MKIRFVKVLVTSLLAVFCLVSCRDAKEKVSTLGDLSGVVTDFDSGQPVAGALVSITGLSSAKTGSDGYYTLTDIDPGSYTVEVTAEGYETATRTIAVKANFSSQCDFALYASKGSISVSPESIDFGTNLPTKQIVVKNTGKKALKITAAAKNSWVSVSPLSFSLPTGDESTLSVSVDRTAFTYAGEFATSLELSFDGSTVPVSVKCTASEEQINGSLKTSATLLKYQKSEIFRSFTITNNGKTQVSYQVSPSDTCKSWVSSISPTFGTLGVGEEQSIEVSVDRSQILQSGTVYGDVIVSYASNAKQLSVKLSVDAGDAVKPEVSTPEVQLVTFNSARLTGSLLSVGSHAVIDYGICYSKNINPELSDNDSKLISCGNTSVPEKIDKAVSNLENGKTYYFRLYAQNAIGTTYSECVTLEVPANSGDITGTVTNSITKAPISQALVEVSGHTAYTDDEGKYSIPGVAAKAHDIFVSASSYTSVKEVVTVQYAKTTVANFELEPAIPGIHVSPANLDFGADCDMLTFNVVNTGATVLNYNVSTDAKWVRSIVPSTGRIGIGGQTDIKVYVSRDSLSQTGTFNSVVKILSEADPQYVNISVMLGVLISPTVSVDKVSDVTYNSATVEGSVVKIGSNVVYEYGFCLATHADPGVDDTCISFTGSVSKPQTFKKDLTGLVPATEYFLRAYARSAAGLSYSTKTLSFTTNASGSEDVGGDGEGSDFNDNEW